MLKTRQYADEGARWANLGAIIFFIGIVCAALTPALVALTGMYAFSNAPKFHLTRTVNGTGHTGPSEFCATSI